MQSKIRYALVWTSLLICSGQAFAQGKQDREVTVNGQTGRAEVIEQSNRIFVDLAALARIGHGTLSYQGNQIVLTIPETVGKESDRGISEPIHSNPNALSQDFMRAGIESIAQMREWASTLAYAIQNGYGVTDQWVAGYRDQAGQALLVTQGLITTDGDRQAFELLKHEFESVRQWSDQLVEAKKKMDTAKYSTSANALRDEPLSQHIITCGHFLARMLGGSVFQDDASCH